MLGPDLILARVTKGRSFAISHAASGPGERLPFVVCVCVCVCVFLSLCVSLTHSHSLRWPSLNPGQCADGLQSNDVNAVTHRASGIALCRM